jgi:hypothetical protein
LRGGLALLRAAPAFTGFLPGEPPPATLDVAAGAGSRPFMIKARCRRSRAPSFSKMAPACAFTVRSEMVRERATSLLLEPPAISLATSSSRWVSVARRGSGAAAPGAGAVAARALLVATSSRFIRVGPIHSPPARTTWATWRRLAAVEWALQVGANPGAEQRQGLVIVGLVGKDGQHRAGKLGPQGIDLGQGGLGGIQAQPDQRHRVGLAGSGAPVRRHCRRGKASSQRGRDCPEGDRNTVAGRLGLSERAM